MNRDNELKDQEKFEKRELSPEDKTRYTLLFSELDKAPELPIDPEFSSLMIKKLVSKKRRENLRENFLFAAAITGVLLIAVAGFRLAKNALQPSWELLNGPLLMPVLLCVSLMIIFQVTDKIYVQDPRLNKLLRRKQ